MKRKRRQALFLSNWLPGFLAIVGVLLLSLFPGHPVPYIPAEHNWIHPLSDVSPAAALFGFDENQAEAGRLVEAGNAALNDARAAEAVELFREAQRLHSFTPGIWEGLAAAYAAMGESELAADARLGAMLQGAHQHVAPTGRFSSQTPLAHDMTGAWGLSVCEHELNPDEPLDLASPGLAVYDLDQDGFKDLICLGGQGFPTKVLRGTAGGQFVVAAHTGLEWHAPTQGVYVVDVNGDGRPDVFLTAIGENRLYLNQGDMQFSLAPATFPPVFGSAAAFADFTDDGKIDMVLGSWLGHEIWQNLDREGKLPTISSTTTVPSPNRETPYHLLNIRVNIGERIVLFEGDGRGGFTDITARSGVDVVATNLNLELLDFNADGRLDLLIINDSTPNRLFLGQGGGRFQDVTERAKLLDLRSGMGLAIADFDRKNGWDFYITHFQGEMNAYYVHRAFEHGAPTYSDSAMEVGLGVPSLPYVGWATFAWDFNADGWEDLLVVNGHMRVAKNPVQLFLNKDGRFLDLSETLPRAWAEPLRARGAALTDLDGDGFDDLIISQSKGQLKALALKPTHERRWLRVEIATGDADARGGTLEIKTADGVTQRRPVRTGSAFFSSQPHEYFFGLGTADAADLVWRGRQFTVTCRRVAAGQIVTVKPTKCEAREPIRSPE